MSFNHNFIISLCCLLLVSISHVSYGQLCEGNSSEVLFLETFGSGDNFGPELETGVTTYNYGSIGNGNYVVTNTSGLNGSHWHNSLDHTPEDTNGYMLLFDASVSPGVFYQNTFAELCSNTNYAFSCFVANIGTFTGCSGSPIEPNLRFRILDPTTNQELGFVDTGLIPTTSQMIWTEYAISFKTLNNQDNIKIEVINIANGGCGNDLAIDDFSLRRCDHIEEITEDLCASETGIIQIGSFTFTEPGFYVFEIDIENSCNTTLVNLTIEGQEVINENFTIKFCAGDTINSHGFQIYQDSIIIDTLSINGDCVSLIRYEYISKETSFTTQTIHLCNNESVQIENILYSESIALTDILTSQIGCDSIIEIVIIKSEIEIDKTNLSSMIELGDEIQIQATTSILDLNQLFWNPNQDLSCNHCLDPIYSPSSTGSYTLSIIDSITQCIDSIQFLVEPCVSTVFIPNAFSPNDDQINDNFILFSNDCIKEINYVKIFDRWGGLMHEGNNLKPSDILWDGYSQNKISRTGVYVYLVEVVLQDGNTKTISGNITLVI